MIEKRSIKRTKTRSPTNRSITTVGQLNVLLSNKYGGIEALPGNRFERIALSDSREEKKALKTLANLVM